MSKNHSYSKPPQPSKYRHTPLRHDSYDDDEGRYSGGRGPVVFFLIFLALACLYLMSVGS